MTQRAEYDQQVDLTKNKWTYVISIYQNDWEGLRLNYYVVYDISHLGAKYDKYLF